MFILVQLNRFLIIFLKFWLFIVENSAFKKYFLVVYENFCWRWDEAMQKWFYRILSKCGNDLIVGWVNAEQTLAYAQTSIVFSWTSNPECWVNRETFQKLTFQGRTQSSYCIQPANLSSELGIYELLTASIQSFIACNDNIWATLWVQISILSS